MAVDSAQGGGSAITTKTRFNDAARTVTVIDGNNQSIVFLSDLRGRLLKQTDPAGNRDSFAYDGNDRVTRWFTRRSHTIAYTYDSLSRVTRKIAQSDTTRFVYNATTGRLDSIVSPGVSVGRAYSSAGQLTEEKSVVNGKTRSVKYAYGQSGWLDTLTDPWNGKYVYGWDVTNRARTITNPFSESFSIRHSSEGLVSAIVFPTGTDSLIYDRSHLVRRAGLNGEVTYPRAYW